MLTRLNNRLPKLKPLRFDTLEGKISLLLAHGLVKNGSPIPMQLPSDAFAQANELVVVACLVGRHRKVRHPIEHLQLVATLGILVDFLASIMDGVAVVIDQRGKHLGQQASPYFIQAHLCFRRKRDVGRALQHAQLAVAPIVVTVANEVLLVQLGLAQRKPAVARRQQHKHAKPRLPWRP